MVNAWVALCRLWWLLWTGEPSLERKRHAIEEDARRFGARRIEWCDPEELAR